MREGGGGSEQIVVPRPGETLEISKKYQNLDYSHDEELEKFRRIRNHPGGGV